MKAISLDLWGTLIVPNPQFAEKRLILLKKMTHKSELDIESSFKNIKKQYDNSAVSTEFIFDVIKTTLDIPLSIEDIMGSYYALFEAYPPFLCEKNIVSVLQDKKGAMGFHLVSNTLVVKGSVLLKTLNRHYDKIFDLFDSLTFSDEVGVAKPDKAIFEKAYAFMRDIPKNSVLHIGDNALTDFQGAKAFGFEAELVNFKKGKGILSILSVLKN
jgi:putative hydrolase of the HAD superfamily